MKHRTMFHVKHNYNCKSFFLKPLPSFRPGDHLSHQFFADFFFILSICLNDDVCRRFIFFTTFLHKFCNKFYVLIFLQQRSVMVVLRSLKNGFRASSQQNGPATFFISATLHSRIGVPPPQETTTLERDSISLRSFVSSSRK